MNNLEWLYEHDSDFAWKVDNWAFEAGGFDTSKPLDEIPWTHPKMREWLMAEHVDGESCRQDAEQGERDESPDCESDSREKLEADVYDFMELVWGAGGRFAKGLTEYTPEHYAEKCMKLLDRQASITSKEWCWTNDSLQEQVNCLTRKLEAAQGVNERQDLEYISLVHEIGTLRAERDRYRELCGKLLDAADEMRRVRDQFDAFTEVD